jgi:hypothetical protein
MNSPRSTLIGTHIAWSGEIDATGEIEAVAARARRAPYQGGTRSPPAQEVRAALARIVRREIGFPRLGHPAIAAESTGAIRGSEQKGVLRMVAGLAVARRHRFLHQAFNEGACGGG